MNQIVKQCLNINKFFKNLFLLFIVAIISCTSNNKLELTNNGVSNYEIVINADASKVVKDASEVLQTYIEKISTVKIPIITEENQSENRQQLSNSGY